MGVAAKFASLFSGNTPRDERKAPVLVRPVSKQGVVVRSVSGGKATPEHPVWVRLLEEKAASKQPVSNTSDLPPGWESLTCLGDIFRLQNEAKGAVCAITVPRVPGKWAVILTAEPNSSPNCSGLFKALEGKGFRVVRPVPADSSVIAFVNTPTSAGGVQSSGRDLSGPCAMFHRIMRESIARRATDVRIDLIKNVNDVEPYGVVKNRIDGLMYDIGSKWSYADLRDAAAAAYQSPEPGSNNESGFREGGAANCTIAVESAPGMGVTHRLRYQQTGTGSGTTIVSRILPLRQKVRKKFVDCGYEESQASMWERAVTRGGGGHFIAGVTGSGKTTTLQVVLAKESELGGRSIVTIEDPIEYPDPSLVQIQVQRKDGLVGEDPFITAKRTAMRLDPDILVPQEIRDVESGSLAKVAVQTGHKVYSTVHAQSALLIIPRLASPEINIPYDVLADRGFLELLCYQTLLPVLCPHCSVPGVDALPPGMIGALLSFVPSKADSLVEKIRTKKVGGCPKCDGRGYYGATVVAEMVELDMRMRELIFAGKRIEIEKYWRALRRTSFDDPDMTGKTAFEHALYKIFRGVIDPVVVQQSFEDIAGYDRIIIEDID